MAEGLPARSCISCGKKGAKGELVRLACGPDGVVADIAERLPGRGAYVCAEPACIKDALSARRLSRAFKGSVGPASYEQFMEGLRRGIERKASSLIGMARKAGKAVWGYDASLEKISRAPGGLLVIAGDISAGTLGRLAREAPEVVARSVRFSTRDGLGAILGTAPVGVVYIADRGLSDALGQVLGRLITINRG